LGPDPLTGSAVLGALDEHLIAEARIWIYGSSARM
jgi:hypothetical protein